MKKRTIISILGLWVALVPLLGLPGAWKNYILIVSGLVISAIAFIKKKKILSASTSYEVPIENVDTKK